MKMVNGAPVYEPNDFGGGKLTPEAVEAEISQHIDEMDGLEKRKRSKLRLQYERIQEFDLNAIQQKIWLMKGIIACDETTGWVGPPGSMKSSIMAELAICVASERDWHGHKAARGSPSGVAYFALERAQLVKRRLIAQCAEMGITGEAFDRLDITVFDDVIDLTAESTVKDIIEAVRSAGYFSNDGLPPEMIIFDTFAKAISAGGGDEQQARDQGKVFTNIQRIKKALGGPHVALVFHTGKDEARGPRGSNASLGDADTMVQISGDEIKTATVIKANDRPEGFLFSFAGKVHEFGRDEDGDSITVNIISADTPEAPKAVERGPRLTKNQQTMFGILHSAGPGGMTLDEWNAAAREAGLGERRKADLTDARNALRTKGLVRSYADRWMVDHG